MIIPLIMVKNEAHTLGRTVDSCRAHGLERVIVCDTGSTDGTRDLARSMGCEVHEVPWRGGYAATRNACEQRVPVEHHALVLDADDILESLSPYTTLGRVALVERRQGPWAWRVPRLMLPGSGYWEGAVHEVFVHREGVGLPVAAIVRHDPSPEGRKRTADRWEKDAKALGDAKIADPRDARSLYYYGLSYFHLAKNSRLILGKDSHLNTAEENLLLAWDRATWEELRWWAMYRLAEVAIEREDWGLACARYATCMKVTPDRGEALYALAWGWRERGMHELAGTLARGIDLKRHRAWSRKATFLFRYDLAEDVNAFGL